VEGALTTRRFNGRRASGYRYILRKKEGGIVATIDQEIAKLLHRLPEAQQQRVLDFARELAEAKPHGIPGANLLAFAGRIPPDDLQRMSDAIDQDCEAVNLGEW
jgi:hypothetical protein